MNEHESLDAGDQRILDLIPHRPPMLLIDRLLEVTTTSAKAIVRVTNNSPFFNLDLGVPSWIGLEYMGQTAALIGGHQQQVSDGEPQVGFLLGTRSFQAELEYFPEGSELLVVCREKTNVGEGLAQFECHILDNLNQSKTYATSVLSVFRKPASSLY